MHIIQKMYFHTSELQTENGNVNMYKRIVLQLQNSGQETNKKHVQTADNVFVTLPLIKS